MRIKFVDLRRQLDTIRGEIDNAIADVLHNNAAEHIGVVPGRPVEARPYRKAARTYT